MQMNKYNFDIEKIIYLYTKENKSTYEISEIMSTYPNMINRILRKYGVSIRDKSDAQSISIENGISKHPTAGTKRSKDTKLKISKKSVDNWKELDQSEKSRRIDGAKERWAAMSDAQREEMHKLASQAVRLAAKEGSKLEKILLSTLNSLGYETHHHRHIIPNDKMEVDLYIPSLKTAIEIDGPSHYLPIWGEDKLKRTIESDNEKNGHIISKGFVLIRIKYKVNNITLTGVDDLTNVLKNILLKIEKEFPESIADRLIEIDFE